MITQATNEGTWKPVKIYAQVPHITHLFYADDVLLFTKAKASQVRNVVSVLDNFCKMSGLKVNIPNLELVVL